MGRGGIEPSTVLVSLRAADDLNEVTKEWAAVGTDELTLAAPWRTFRWCLGRHYGGTYWSSTLRGPVICESRLELAGLLFADFEPSVRHIVAQPFFLRATVDQKVCKHVPDHLLITDEALSLWMSSLSVAMADPKVAFALEWTREVVEARGWRYEVATEPWAVELGNVRFLSLEAVRKN